MEVDGRLIMTTMLYSYSRGEAEMNEYGYVTVFGSGGAGTHYEETGLVDADGTYKVLTNSELSQNFYGEIEPGWGEKFVNLYEYIQKIKEKDTKYSFDAVVKTEFVDTGETVYSFLVRRWIGDFDDEEVDDPKMYTDSEYAKAFKKAGIDYLTKAELQEKKNSLIREDIRNGGEIEWKLLYEDKTEELTDE